MVKTIQHKYSDSPQLNCAGKQDRSSSQGRDGRTEKKKASLHTGACPASVHFEKTQFWKFPLCGFTASESHGLWSFTEMEIAFFVKELRSVVADKHVERKKSDQDSCWAACERQSNVAALNISDSETHAATQRVPTMFPNRGLFTD